MREVTGYSISQSKTAIRGQDDSFTSMTTGNNTETNKMTASGKTLTSLDVILQAIATLRPEMPVSRNIDVETASTVAVLVPAKGSGFVTVVLVTMAPHGCFGKRYRVATMKKDEIGDWDDFASVRDAVAAAQKKDKFVYDFASAMSRAMMSDMHKGSKYWGTEYGVRLSDWTHDTDKIYY